VCSGDIVFQDETTGAGVSGVAAECSDATPLELCPHTVCSEQRVVETTGECVQKLSLFNAVRRSEGAIVAIA